MDITTKEAIGQIAERVRQYRIQSSITQKQLAERTGVSLRGIQRFEKGEDIQLGNFIRILDGLGLSDHLQQSIPDMTKRPSMYLRENKMRQRVRLSDSQRMEKAFRTGFKWGDEE